MFAPPVENMPVVPTAAPALMYGASSGDRMKRKLSAQERVLDAASVLLDGGYIVLGKGRRDYAVVRVVR